MNDNNTGVIFIVRNRKLWLVSLLIGAIVGGGITFILPKKYRSTAIIYPYSSHTREDLISNPQFGYESESEQLLQLLHSQSMRDRTVQKFQLYDYYELDTNSQSWKSDLTLKYVQDVNFSRSQYLSIVISVVMKDPLLAADIANFQVAEINQYRASIFDQNREADFKAAQQELEHSVQSMEALKDSIYTLKGGENTLLFNFIENLDNEDFDPSTFITSPELERLIVDYRFAYDRYIQAHSDFQEKEKAINGPIPSVYSVDKAAPNYKKVAPSLMVNSLLGALVLFVLVFTIRFVVEKWQIAKELVKD